MKTFKLFAFLLLGASSFSTMASNDPIVLDFNDLAYNATAKPTISYKGFILSGSSYMIDKRYYPSHPSIAGMDKYGGMFGYSMGKPLTITMKDNTTFDFNGFATSLVHSGGTVIAKGFLNGVEVYSTSSSFSSAADIYTLNYNYTGIDKLVISVENKSSYNNYFLYDNLAFNGASVTPVPEPSTYAMMIAGLGMVGLMIKRRKMA